MKTKYILQGGFDPINQAKDIFGFYKEILKDVPDKKLKVLIVPFAKEIDRISVATERVKSEFNVNKKEKNIEFEIANEEIFEKQVKSADIIYLQGGKTLKIIEALKKIPNLKELFKGKIVAGDSAGANVLGKYYFSPKDNIINEGLGVLPIKIVSHYKDKYKDVFKDFKSNLENVYIREYELRIFIEN